MSDTSMTPEQIQKAIDGGYRTAAIVFLSAVEVLEERFGKEDAHELAREIVRKKAEAAGKIAASKFGTGGFQNLMDAQKSGFPNLEILEFSPTRYVIRDKHCPIAEAWKQIGVDAGRIKELGDLYCWGDLHFARAFNPNIDLDFEARIVEGKPYCQWAFSLSET